MARWDYDRRTPGFDLPHGCTVSFAFLGACLLTYVSSFLVRAPIWSWAIFFTDRFWLRPWTLVTYPIVLPISTSPLTVVLYGLWIWMIGGGLERSWGARVYLVFLLAVSALSALLIALGTALLAIAPGFWPAPPPIPVFGPLLTVSAVTVAWGMANPNASILLYFVLPVQAKWIAWIDMVYVFWQFGLIHPLLGLFAVGGCLASWWYVRRGRAYAWARGVSPGWGLLDAGARAGFRWSDLNPFARYARWKRRRDFARLIRISEFRADKDDRSKLN